MRRDRREAAARQASRRDRAGWCSRAASTLALLAVLLAALAACSSGGSSSTVGRGLRIETPGTRPGTVSGPQVLVAVAGPGASTAGGVKFSLDGRDVTAPSTPVVRNGRTLALIGGLTPGDHQIVATAGDSTATASVTAYPSTGPVFSGPQLPLPVCTTEQFGLGPATDSSCSAPTKVTWWYAPAATSPSSRPSGAAAPGGMTGNFRPLSSPRERPPDLATTTVDGHTVPYIVRLETGTLDRAVYVYAVLAPDGDPTWQHDDVGWNDRLVYRYGGGCGTTYSQGSLLATPVLDDSLLSRGYAVATATFNTFQNQCNDVLSAETTMMVKQRITNVIGPPMFTIGDGGSGGAIQQLLIAQNYPGLLDAIAPVIPFPDAISIAPGVTDCGLLDHFYDTAGSSFTEAQRAAVNDQLSVGTCRLWQASFLATIDPTTGCDAAIPPAQIYSDANPKGLRCTLQDSNRNLFGLDPKTGFAERPLSNVGVQYGLKALRARTITPEQFVLLNELIGGYDIDGRFTAARETAPDDAFRRAYRTGRVNAGAGDLARIPILLENVYTDDAGDIHDRERVFEIRARIRKASDSASNVIVWTVPAHGPATANLTGAIAGAAQRVALLDQWLTSGTPPPAAVDTCTTPDGDVERGAGVYDHADPCTRDYPVHGDARTGAGATQANDVLACQLRPLDRKAEPATFTDEQWRRLQAVFPHGVCDWTKPGIGQTEMAATWFSYADPANPAPLS